MDCPDKRAYPHRVHGPGALPLSRSAGLAIAVMLGMAQAAAQAGVAETPSDWLAAAVDALCGPGPIDGQSAQLALPGSWLLAEARHPKSGPAARISLRLAVSDGDELGVEQRLAGGVARQFRVSYSTFDGDFDPEPRLLAIADGGCHIRSGRRLRRDGPVWQFLDQLDGDLRTVRWSETLQAPWPAGRDPGGPRVGLVDSGLAYDLPLFRDRLARGPDGTPLGYDYWDLDPYPYDGDVARGPFLPIRHGTAVASVIAREAPNAALVPFRYPRPDMSRLGDLVARAEAAGVRILAMPLGSRTRSDWTAFEHALGETDILAIVSAGNDGRDIDRTPVWPAASDHPQVVVVTSAGSGGRLAPGSNWGAQSVDIMLPAENVPVTDFRGARTRASGSSFAVPRLAALAARLLERAPELTATELKQAILDRAVASPFVRDGAVAGGWIPDPQSD